MKPQELLVLQSNNEIAKGAIISFCVCDSRAKPSGSECIKNNLIRSRNTIPIQPRKYLFVIKCLTNLSHRSHGAETHTESLHIFSRHHVRAARSRENMNYRERVECCWQAGLPW